MTRRETVGHSPPPTQPSPTRGEGFPETSGADPAPLVGNEGTTAASGDVPVPSPTTGVGPTGSLSTNPAPSSPSGKGAAESLSTNPAPSPLVGEGWGGGSRIPRRDSENRRARIPQRDFARHLRKNMTDAERKLWRILRLRQVDGHRFRRQAPIGPYIADFACHEVKLIVELDGGRHAIRAEEDAHRTQWLESQGYRVLRFWNHLIFEDDEAVAAAIDSTLHPESPSRPAPVAASASPRDPST